MAGDSAGGGLCLSVLTVLRDMGLEQPAGAVLISPWVDLTHSFPSVMKNTATVCWHCGNRTMAVSLINSAFEMIGYHPSPRVYTQTFTNMAYRVCA